MFNKEQALYVKGNIIQNGVPDSQGDVLNKSEIKQIFTTFNNQNSFELHHNGLPVEGVTLLENYISSTDELIGGITVPSASWNVVLKVTCPQIQKQIREGVFNGLSLSNRVKSECACGLTGQIRYKDLPDASCVVPIFISLVGSGANGVPLEPYDYAAYINKSKTGCVKVNLLDELKSLIQRAEDDSPVIEKSAETVEEGETSEEAPVIPKQDEPEDEEPSIDSEEEEDDDEAKSDESEDDSPVIEKSEEEPSISDLLARITALEKSVEELKPAKVEKAEEEEEEEEEEVATVITKSAKVVITEEATETKNNFYEMTGRDPATGKKL